jgi:hypothetical protein
VNALVERRFTDIGMPGHPPHRGGKARGKWPGQHVLLITDGIQEAPPTSKYYSDGSFNHALLENTKTIQKKRLEDPALGLGAHRGLDSRRRSRPSTAS